MRLLRRGCARVLTRVRSNLDPAADDGAPLVSKLVFNFFFFIRNMYFSFYKRSVCGHDRHA